MEAEQRQRQRLQRVHPPAGQSEDGSEEEEEGDAGHLGGAGRKRRREEQPARTIHLVSISYRIFLKSITCAIMSYSFLYGSRVAELFVLAWMAFALVKVLNRLMELMQEVSRQH